MVIAQPENNVDTKTYLLGYMIDSQGKRITVKVNLDEDGFIRFTPIKEKVFA